MMDLRTIPLIFAALDWFRRDGFAYERQLLWIGIVCIRKEIQTKKYKIHFAPAAG